MRAPAGGYLDDRDYDRGDYWKNNDKSHNGGKHKKGNRKRKSECKKAHMKWKELNEDLLEALSRCFCHQGRTLPETRSVLRRYNAGWAVG